MFKALMNWMSNAASAVATKYALRVSVAVPFVFAAGFVIAALTTQAIELLGTRDGYFCMAAGFAVLGALAALFVWWREKGEEKTANTPDVAAVARTAKKVAVDVPRAIAGAATSTTGKTLPGWSLVATAVLLLLFATQAKRY